MIAFKKSWILQSVKWGGNVFLFLAAVSVSASTEWAQQVWPFVCYTIGCLIWAGAAIKMKDRPLLWQMVFFTIVDIYGIWIRL